MNDSNSNDNFVALYKRHVSTVYRVCFSYLRNTGDAEDAVQSVFLKLLEKPYDFSSVEHQKAWLIRVAANHCKDVLKHSWAKRTSLDAVPEPSAPEIESDQTLEIVMSLPEDLRICIYLYYYEGYKSAEIAELLGKKHSTVRNYLSDARKILKQKLGTIDD